MNMNAYEEYKTIIIAKFNTATAVRARLDAVCWDVYRMISMYEYMTASVNWYSRLLVRFLLPSVSLYFDVSRVE